MEALYRQIAALGRRYRAQKIVLFGSRARGTQRERSDIDLAVYGMPPENQAAFWAAVDELDTPYEFDIVQVRETTSPALLANIEKEGQVLMSRKEEKLEQLNKAVARLKEALDQQQILQLDIVRDGIIQRFEFCTELSWKAMREFLQEEGYTQIDSPKAVVRKAFACGMIADGDGWIALLNDRNLTSHVYNEEDAAAILQRIEARYVSLFTDLLQALEEMR